MSASEGSRKTEAARHRLTGPGEETDPVVRVLWVETRRIAAIDWPQLLARLDPAERMRAARFRFAADRDAYIAAHALLRSALATELGQPAPEIGLAADANGKPYLAGSPVRFNLSHTRGLVAVAIAHGTEVGIDVEQVDPRRLGADTAEHHFARSEVEQLYALPRAARTDASFAFWTLKEAYVKAVGLGLRIPLDAFAFTLSPLTIRFSPRLADDPRLWQFHREEPVPGFAMAVAVRRDHHRSVRIHVLEVDPAGTAARG